MEEEGRESGYQPELRYKCVYHMKTLQTGLGVWFKTVDYEPLTEYFVSHNDCGIRRC